MAEGKTTIGIQDVLEAQRVLRYYRSIAEQKKDLEKAFAGQFEHADTWNKIPKICYNLVRPIAKSLSKLYSYPVVRRWEKDNSKESKIFESVKNYDRTMKTIDVYTLLGGTTAVRPVWDPEIKKFSYAIYTRDMINITADAVDPSIINQLCLKWSDRGSEIEHIWDSDKFIEKIGGVITKETEHRYKRIPVILFSNEDQPWSCVEGPAQDLTEANLVLNWLMTMLNDIGVIQAAGLLVTKGRDNTTKLKVGHRTYVDLPPLESADAKYINSNADIDKLISIINLNLDMFLSSRNIPESAIRATQDVAKSGVSLVYEQAAIIDYMNERKIQFRDKDAELVALSVQVLLMERDNNGSFIPELPVVKYKDFEMPMSTEERNNWQFKIDNNMATPVDMLMSQEPGLDDKTATDRIAKNKRLNASLGLMGAQADRLMLDKPEADKPATAEPEPDQAAALEEAQAKLKGTVGGVTAILAIQESVASGTTGYEAAVTVLKEIYGFDPVLARRILGKPKAITAPKPDVV